MGECIGATPSIKVDFHKKSGLVASAARWQPKAG